MPPSLSSPAATASAHGLSRRKVGCRMTSNSRSDVAEIAARHDPAAWTRTFAYRSRSELPFDVRAVPPSAGLLLDTTVYLDAMRFGLPSEIGMLIRRNPLSHSAVACAEIAIAIGHLDPR